MNSRHVKYLLIGGGLASGSAAGTIRAFDPEGTILLVAQEIVRPYHRPPLSKDFLRRQTPREALFTVESQWFEKNRVELRTGRRAAHLDTTRGAVTLADGESITYDKLLLATGASPRLLDIPGADLPNLFYLRTLEDATRIQTAFDKALREGRTHARGRGKVAIIGAGFLGIELAASLTQLGLAVDLLCADSHPWHRIAGENTGRFLTRVLESHDVRVHLNSRPSRLEGDGRVQRIAIGDGRTVDCDFAIATVGGIAHRELLRNTPIAAEKAILVDQHCRTNVHNIFAAGDCAAIFDPLFGKYRVIDHWENAVATGALAGRNMAGASEAYKIVNHFSTEAFDVLLHGWGDARFVDRRLTRGGANGTPAAGGVAEIGIAADGRVAQVLAIGREGEHELLRTLVAQRVQTSGKEELLKDPVSSLEALIG